LNWETSLVIALLLLSTSIGIGLAVFIWTRKEIPGAWAFMVLSIALAEWSFTYALEIGAPDLASKTLWAQFQYVGLAMIPPAWLIFTRHYSRRERETPWHHIILFSIIPFVTILVAFSSRHHNLLWSKIWLNTDGPLRTFDASYGPWWWLFFLYSYSLLFWGSIVLFTAWRLYSSWFKWQFAVLLCSLFLPWSANALYISRLSPVTQLDLGPFAFAISALILGLGIFRYRLFDIYPVARSSRIDTLQSAALILDRKDRVMDVNSVMRNTLITNGNEPVGEQAANIFDWWAQIDSKYRDAIEVQQDICLEIDRITRYYNLQITPLWNQQQKLSGRLVLLRDITANKQAEEAVALAQVKTEFLAKVGHELRTPLTAIIGVVDMMQRGFYGPLNEDQSEAIEILHMSTQHIARLVGDLLQQASLEHGDFSLEVSNFSIRQLVEQMDRNLSGYAKAKGLDLFTEIDPEMPPKLDGDSLRIYQILVNLAQNAIKYTQAGSVKVRIYKQDESHWVIEVADTGPGIPPELQEHIFDPFQHVSQTKLAQPSSRGFGLGLSIVKQLSDLMGGEVILDSKIGRGTTFRVVFPFVNE
jgi:signal transduction histidine kinase